jgi:uncharacterized protein (TIGR02118 family)
LAKVVGMVRKRADMTHAEFRDYWLNRHSRLEKESLATNPVRRIVANFWQEDMIGEVGFDGMVELYYDSIEDLRRVWGGGHDDTMRADEANFCDPDFRVFCIVEEVEIGRNPA